MDIQFHIGYIFFILWTYVCNAKVTQQHGEIQYFDERYISEARAFTSRRGRGEPYLTNITIVTRTETNDNITIKVVAVLRSIGSIVFHEMKACDALKIPWIKQIRDIYSNFTDCPIRAGRYQVYNLEMPPKHFPLPVPKGEGTLHLYTYITHNMKVILYAVLKIVSS